MKDLQEAKRLISQLEFIVRTGLTYHTMETRKNLQDSARQWLAKNTEQQVQADSPAGPTA